MPPLLLLIVYLRRRGRVVFLRASVRAPLSAAGLGLSRRAERTKLGEVEVLIELDRLVKLVTAVPGGRGGPRSSLYVYRSRVNPTPDLNPSMSIYFINRFTQACHRRACGGVPRSGLYVYRSIHPSIYLYIHSSIYVYLLY